MSKSMERCHRYFWCGGIFPISCQVNDELHSMIREDTKQTIEIQVDFPSWQCDSRKYSSTQKVNGGNVPSLQGSIHHPHPAHYWDSSVWWCHLQRFHVVLLHHFHNHLPESTLPWIASIPTCIGTKWPAMVDGVLKTHFRTGLFSFTSLSTETDGSILLVNCYLLHHNSASHLPQIPPKISLELHDGIQSELVFCIISLS